MSRHLLITIEVPDWLPDMRAQELAEDYIGRHDKDGKYFGPKIVEAKWGDAP